MKSSLLYRKILVSFALALSILAAGSVRQFLPFSGPQEVKEVREGQAKGSDAGSDKEIVAAIQVIAVIPFLKIDLDNDLLAELAPVFFELKERRFYTSVPLFASAYFRNLFTCCIPVNAP